MNNQNPPPEEYTFKLCLLGDSAVGKTSLRRTYMGASFIHNHVLTLGADFSMQDVMVNSGENVKVQIWDLAGQDLFQTLRHRFLGGTSAAIIVFDITRKETLQNIPKWINDLWNNNKDRSIPLLIIGNKIDLSSMRQITHDEATSFIENFKKENEEKIPYVAYMETSAKTGENVSDSFHQLTQITFDSFIAH